MHNSGTPEVGVAKFSTHMSFENVYELCLFTALIGLPMHVYCPLYVHMRTYYPKLKYTYASR